MKRILFSIVALFVVTFSLSAQNNAAKADDFGRIILSTHLDAAKSNVPQNAANLLKGKLSQIATANGMGGGRMQRFIITANVKVLTQDITATQPPMHAYTLEITFYIGDGIDGTLFASTSVTSKGVGETQDKAFISAIKNIKPKNPDLTALVETGKIRILEYYNSQCDMILAKATSLAKQQEYDEAIYTLMSVPEICKECYEQALETTASVYQQKIDEEGKALLNEARSVWKAGQDVAAAEAAGEIISKINPKSSAFNDVNKLQSEIAARVKELDNREWQYILQEQANAHEEEMSYIDACKEVAKAESNLQSKTIVYYYSWW